jgi:uncharacterized membrane protein HdeD (DUF308 family)
MRLTPLADDLTGIWRLLVVRAGIVIVLSIAAMPWPEMTVAVVIVLASTIALVAGLVDAAIAGALQSRAPGGWVLMPEAVVGILLGAAVLLYPLVPLGVVGVLMALWMFSRGIMLATVARGAASDTMMRTFALGWAVASVLAPAFLLARWGETTLLPLVYLLLAYTLVWSALELAVGLHLRARGRAARHV